MLDYLTKPTIDAVYKNLDLKEYLETAVDSSYTGPCMFRPSIEHCSDRLFQDLFVGGTIVKFDHWDDEYPIFKVITSTSRYADEVLCIPLPFLQKMSDENFRPWNISSVLRNNITNNWELVVDYAEGKVVVQDLDTGEILLRDFGDVTHGKAFTKYGNTPYPMKESHGVVLNKEQAEEVGLPEGAIIPFVEFETNAEKGVLCKLHGTDKKFPYKELAFRKSRYFRELIGERPHFIRFGDDS